MRFNELDGEISIKDTNEIYQVVDCFDINLVREGLGIFVTPNGSMDMQLIEIEWSERLHTSFLDQKECYIGANTTIFKTVEYILSSTSFTEIQCTMIEHALYWYFMNKLGLSSKFPLAYKVGPH